MKKIIYTPLFFLLCSCTTLSSSSTSAQKLFDDYWEWSMTENPELAVNLNIKGAPIDKLASLTTQKMQERKKQLMVFLDRTQKLLKNSHPERTKIHLGILKTMLNNEIQEIDFKGYLTPFLSAWGPHSGFITMSAIIPLKGTGDVEKYIQRVKNFKTRKDELIAIMGEAIKTGYAPPGIIYKGYEKGFSTIYKTPVHKSRLLEPLKKAKGLSPTQKKAYENKLKQAIQKDFYPAIKDLKNYWVKTYAPSFRKKIGIDNVPRGKDFYNFLVRKFTTTNMTADQIHRLGLSEVQRIKAEMMKVIRKTGWKGSFASFTKHLRTNPRFYAKSKQELLDKVAFALKKMDGKLPELFKKLPRTPYGIKEVPAAIAPKSTTAYYNIPPLDGSRAGFYFVNTYNLKARPLYEVEALSLHEAVPGHHLQLALQMENKDQPRFLSLAHFTAFIEGWALYAEKLGLEVGFYKDPYSDFGRLSYEMWRALRLVVDTGMHSKGWSRQKAMNFMLANSALTKTNVTAEVDRYIGWPGQALAYKIGQLKIIELRQRAEQKLKRNFDVREFHVVVLRNGSLPLHLLEKEVNAWLQ